MVRTCCFILLILILSKCKENSSERLDLKPYKEIYKIDFLPDTALPNGNFIKYLVNKDTMDENLYVKYGNKNFDSIIIFKEKVPGINCATPAFFYSAKNSISLITNCMNSVMAIYLPLNVKDSVKYFDPLFIDFSKHIILFNDYHKYDNSNCLDTLVLSDFEMSNKSLFIVPHLNCAGMHNCIDSIYIEDNFIILKSSNSLNCDANNQPEKETTQISRMMIPWLK